MLLPGLSTQLQIYFHILLGYISINLMSFSILQAGGLDKLTLDSLYDDAIARRTNPGGNYQMDQMAPNPFEALQCPQDPFHASNTITPPASVQMAAMAQQQAYMMQQQQQPLREDGTNPFGNPYGAPGVPSYPPNNPYTGFM